MNRKSCEREDQSSAEAGRGTIDSETVLHAEQCSVCSEILLVSKFLNEHAVLAYHERTALLDPAVLWQKSRLRAQLQAVRVALRPIRFMKVIAVVAFVCSPWLRPLLPIGREFAASWSRTLGLSLVSASKLWPIAANQSTLFLGALGTILLLGLSSWYMLRQE